MVEGKVHIGDYVLYTPDSITANYLVDGSKSTSTPGNSTADQTHTRESLEWRVLDIEGDQLRLISTEPTEFELTLQGANGYNNAVKLIDELCAIYGGSKGTAQGLKIEDIEEHTFDYEFGHSTYKPSFKMYPLIIAQENWQLGNPSTGYLGLSQQDTWYTGSTTAGTLNITYTNWNKSYSSGSASTEWENPMYYTLFINNGSDYTTYWMSSRCVHANGAQAAYDVRCIYSGQVYAGTTYESTDYARSVEANIRPVITLKSNIKVNGGDGISGWIIE